MMAEVHFRKTHHSGVPYPACMHMTDRIQGTTTVQKQAVTCAVCRMMGGAA